MIRIITDADADITLSEAKKLNIDVVPIGITFADGPHPQENTPEEFYLFYERLMAAEELPKTSNPSPQEYLKFYEKAKENKEKALVITVSSALSGTYQSALVAKDAIDYEDIYVVDSRNAIGGQRILVEKAIEMRDQGHGVEEIVKVLEELREKVMIAGMLDTLTYLSKGGRIPKGLASFGNAISIKPTLYLKDFKLQLLKMNRGRKAAMKTMWSLLDEGFDPEQPVMFGYTNNIEMGQEFQRMTEEKYGLENTRLLPIGGGVGAHLGENCVVLTFVKK